MSKFVKTILVISGILVGIGVICVAAAAGMGVTMKDLENPLGNQIVSHIYRLDNLDDFEVRLDVSTDDGIHLNVESGESKVGGADAPETAVIEDRFENVAH